MASSPNDIERSMLQKALRRGHEEMVEKVYHYLTEAGDRSWLQNRLYIMKYEECWSMEFSQTKLLDQYLELAKSVKNKNSAGLAALAMKLIGGERSMLVGLDQKEQDAIRSVANGVKDPEQFWLWIKSQPEYSKNKHRIDSAEKARKKAGFPGDKAMMLAAAYLTVKYRVPAVHAQEAETEDEFPYYVAMDKHTDLGKKIYEEVSEQTGLLPVRAMRLGFYMEGSVCNAVSDSPFWDYLKLWELKRMGFTLEQAQEKWEKDLKPLMIQKTEDEVKLLQNRIDNLKEENTFSQLTFSF